MSGEAYTDPQYHSDQEMQIPNVSGTSTATASAAVIAATDASKFELFYKCKLLALKAQILTASGDAQAQFKIMNGATQLADIAVGTSTALADVDGTMTSSASIAANTELQIDYAGTATASAGVLTIGPANIRLTYQRLFA